LKWRVFWVGENLAEGVVFKELSGWVGRTAFCSTFCCSVGLIGERGRWQLAGCEVG